MATAKPNMSAIWAAGGSSVQPAPSKIQEGWVAEKPPFQSENWVQQRQDFYLKHIDERGVPGWAIFSEYEKGALIWHADKIWESLQFPNIGNDPLTTVGFWRSQEYVDKRGDVMTGPLVIEENLRLRESTTPGLGELAFEFEDRSAVRAALVYNNVTRTVEIRLTDINGLAVPGLLMNPGGDLLWRNGKVWTDINDGAGTGLNADLLDGLHAAEIIGAQSKDNFWFSFGNGSDGAKVVSTNEALAPGYYDFTTFSMNAGTILSLSANGPLVIRCTTSFTMNTGCTIDVNGQGGAGGIGGGGIGGGAGLPGLGGSTSYVYLGGRGGGGGADTSVFGGDGGGTFYKEGGRRGVTNSGNGIAGSDLTIEELNEIITAGLRPVSGGGGGGGGGDNNGSGSNGGNGGGFIIIESPVINFIGGGSILMANGTNGVAVDGGFIAGAGGGGGGLIALRYNTLTGTYVASANGGLGNIANRGNGANGGDGLVNVTVI